MILYEYIHSIVFLGISIGSSVIALGYQLTPKYIKQTKPNNNAVDNNPEAKTFFSNIYVWVT